MRFLRRLWTIKWIKLRFASSGCHSSDWPLVSEDLWNVVVIVEFWQRESHKRLAESNGILLESHNRNSWQAQSPASCQDWMLDRIVNLTSHEFWKSIKLLWRIWGVRSRRINRCLLIMRYFRHKYCYANELASANYTSYDPRCIQIVWIFSVNNQQPTYLLTISNKIRFDCFRRFFNEKLTICGSPIASIVLLLPYLCTIYGNIKVPMNPPTK